MFICVGTNRLLTKLYGSSALLLNAPSLVMGPRLLVTDEDDGQVSLYE